MPIRIYLFKCNHCGLLYFGKTESRNWKTYKGSGKYWKVHLKKHKATISKKWIGYFIKKESAKIFCLWYSRVKNIVKSNLYANLIEENGLDGGFNMTGKKHTEETKLKMINNHTKSWKGKKHTKETKLKMSKNHKGFKNKTHKKETKLKMSNSRKGMKYKKVICPHCKKEGAINAMKRYCFNNCNGLYGVLI